MDHCPPPETIWHEIKNDQGQIIRREGRTIAYFCRDKVVEHAEANPEAKEE